MTDQKDPWERLVEASKSAPPAEELETSPPAISVKSLRESVQALVLAMTWRRWSLLAALVAGIIFLVFYLFFRDDSPSQPIIPTEPPADPAAS